MVFIASPHVVASTGTLKSGVQIRRPAPRDPHTHKLPETAVQITTATPMMAHTTKDDKKDVVIHDVFKVLTHQQGFDS